MSNEILASELTDDPLDRGYSEMTDVEVFASLQTKNITVPYTRFISLRALAAVLTDAEYATFKGFLTSVASAGPRYADMVEMIEMPCNDEGDTGGLDFGLAEVRAMIDQFGQLEGMADAAVKAKALAEHDISRAEQLGFGARLIDVIRTRRSI